MRHPADATTIASAVREQQTTAREVVDEALARIEMHATNAIVTTNARASRSAAAAVDVAVARGEDPGPLAGVPFTVKDTLATAGQRATGGSLVLAEHVAVRDAIVVARLRAAGAVLVGKTNCPEFALQPRTDNRVFGPTLHPFLPGCSPGGSSGGCAAAVAGGLVPFSIGGDYGGSIRYPAACTGIYGLRPGDGSVPTDGHVPPPAGGSPRDRFQTVGPLARTARDVGLVFAVISGVGVGVDAPPTLGAAAVGNRGRIGVVRAGWTGAAGVVAAVAATANALTGAGYDVVDVDPAPFVAAGGVFDAWRATDDYADLRALVAGREAELTPHIVQLLAAAPVPSDQEPALAAVVRAVDALLATTPIMVLPIARVGVLGLGATTVEVGGATESVDALQILAPSRAVSLLGLPALAIPAGIDGQSRPVGVQLVGRAGSEPDLVALAIGLASAPAFGDAPVAAVDDDV